jgi:hypothetical protein
VVKVKVAAAANHWRHPIQLDKFWLSGPMQDPGAHGVGGLRCGMTHFKLSCGGKMEKRGEDAKC